MAPTTRSISVNVSSTSSAEDSQGSAHMSNNCAIALALLLLIATGMLALLARVYSPLSPSLSSSATFRFSPGRPGPSVVPPLPSTPTQQYSPPGYLQGTIRVAGGYYMIESGSCGRDTILTTSECDAAATALGLPDKTSTDIKRQTASLIPRGCVFLRSFLYVIRRGSSSASCTSSRQCICTFTPPSPPPSPPSQLPPPPPPHAAAHATAHAAANAATRPKEGPVPKVSPSFPSSQSPSGATRLIHTATLEPVCIGRAHTLTVDKAMVINFKSIIHEDEDDEDEDEEEDEEEDDEATEKFKPATALVLPTLTPEACAEIIADARREAKASGGWRPRAIGCCTNDVLVSSLSNPVQQRIRDALEQVMPVVIEHFPEANLKPRSLPTDPKTFFIIKYTAGKGRASFGLHVDHTAVTVNIALSDDFEGGGTFMRASSKSAPTEAGRSSQGFCLRPRTGMALVHKGGVAHAGNAVTRGSRYVLVAFFYGGEKPAPPLPMPLPQRNPPAEEAEGRTSSPSGPRRLQLAAPRPLLLNTSFPDDMMLRTEEFYYSDEY